MANCLACGDSLDDDTVIATTTFSGFTVSKLNGHTIRTHARCISLTFPEAAPLPARREPDLVSVDSSDLGWEAWCLDHGNVAIKDTEDDAHLVAAHHLARVHVGYFVRASGPVPIKDGMLS